MESAKEVKGRPLPNASLEILQKLREENCNSNSKDFNLTSFQIFLRRKLSPESPNRNMLLFHGTGVGKCHGKDTSILMHDGSAKMVQDITEGELLMGDDSTPRRVLSLARGRDELFQIKNSNGESFVVNKEHILCLKDRGTDTITEIAVKDFLNLSQKLQRNMKGYKVPVDFPAKELPIDPYAFGVKLGDLGDIFIHVNNLIENKQIPMDYMINSREVRLQVLAGLIDTCGYLVDNIYRLTQKSKKITDDIVFLARSVGLATITKKEIETIHASCYSVFISGCIEMIPTKILRKKASKQTQVIDVLRYGFTVTPLAEGDYYGFTLDGNSRYLLGDFSVTHNTASAIQVAEEYILHPEFQDKKVIVLAGAAVQGSFRNQLFSVNRAEEGSAQITGRRYIDMLQRAQKERLRWEDADSREALSKTIKNIIDDFYDFESYGAFAGRVERLAIHEGDAGLRREFSNRLLIIDEAHNLRTGDATSKLVSMQLERLLKKVPGITLVLMTATPMFDTFDEILYYFNLFLWNDRRQPATQRIVIDDFFKKDGTFATPEAESQFRGWVNEYVSFIRGENPFTFPFRLPPPDRMIVPADRETTPRGEKIKEPRKFLPLVGSIVESPQKEQVELAIGSSKTDMIYTLVTSPDPTKDITECFVKGTNDQRFMYQYAKGIPAFLSPSMLSKHSAKFATVIGCIKGGTGVCFVYSNFVRKGIEMFAASLEEAGFEPYAGPRVLENPSKESTSGSSGKYVLLNETNIDKVLTTLQSKKNANGELIKVVLGSPFVSEGVDFKYIRQVHILDPWDNMSRMDQIIGRGLRTCSHAILPFKEQNCTVYLHVCRLADSTQECLDEYVYRERVERKAKDIARVKRILQESAVDCSLQITTNALPDDWKNLMVPQIRSEDKKEIVYSLSQLSGPSFEEGSTPLVCHPHPQILDADYVRPLSSYLDIESEIYSTLTRLFSEKPIWSRNELLEHPSMIADKSVVQFLIENARENNIRVRDPTGREGTLESKGEMYAFKPSDVAPNATMIERVAHVKEKPFERIVLEEPRIEEKENIVIPSNLVDTTRMNYAWKFGVGTYPVNVLNWYIVDTVLPKSEKEKVILSLPRTGNLPEYMQGLVVPGYNFLVLGPGKIFGENGDLVIPIGAEKDAFNEWINNHIASIITAVKEQGKIICTMGQNKGGLPVIKFAAFKVQDGTIIREKREKTITAKECLFYTLPDLDAFARALSPDGFPEGISKKDDRCMILGLLTRKAVLDGSPFVYWIRPELMDFLSVEPYKTALRSKLK